MRLFTYLVVGAVGTGLVWAEQAGSCPCCRAPAAVPNRPAASCHDAVAEPAAEYFCPMHPRVVRDKRGQKCPICAMPLAARKRGAAAPGCCAVAAVPANAKGGGKSAEPVAADEAKIKANLAKLPEADRKLAEAQRYCAVEDDSRLGSMGVPLKVMIKDQPVFLCCKGCAKGADADPDRTLSKVKELRAKYGEKK